MLAKFKVQDVCFNSPIKEEATQMELKLTAVTEKPFDPDGVSEDNSFSRWTPSGEVKMTVTNPALFEQFKIGQKYYLSFTLAE